MENYIPNRLILDTTLPNEHKPKKYDAFKGDTFNQIGMGTQTMPCWEQTKKQDAWEEQIPVLKYSDSCQKEGSPRAREAETIDKGWRS